MSIHPSSLVRPASLMLAAALISACGKSTELTDANRPPVLRPDGSSEISTGLNALDEGASKSTPVSADAAPGSTEQTASLLSLMELAQSRGAISVDATTTPKTDLNSLAMAAPAESFAEANPGVSFSLPAEPDLSIKPPDELRPFKGVITPELPETPAESPGDRRTRLIAELGSVLDGEVAQSATPAPTLAQIVSLQFLAPPGERTLVTSDNPGGSFGGASKSPPESPQSLNAHNDPLDAYLNSSALSPRERDMLLAWSAFVLKTRNAITESHDLVKIKQPAQELADSLSAWSPLALSELKLCSRVDGFGVYNELKKFGGQHKFLVGRPARMIVYIEPTSFTRTRKSKDGVWGHEVTLSQDLRLYHAAKDADTLVWRKPDQLIADFSRNVRRDFFVVQVIDLPATLGVGAYSLKVIVTDKANGAQAEAIVPIELIADASALRE